MTMLNQIRLIRNIGKFDSASGCASLQFPQLTLIYAENGRGKTTLSAIMRSLATGDPNPISERCRLQSLHSPHVVLSLATGIVNFQNNAWTQPLPRMLVFDDVFVDQNVYSGLSVAFEHRQRLHEFIIGAQGVMLGKALQTLVDRNEEHGRALRSKSDAIPAGIRGKLGIDAFCALPARATVDDDIQATERRLAAVRDQHTIHHAAVFERFDLPPFDLAQTEALLARDLVGLDRAAVAQVQAHLANLGPDGESWVADGMRLVQISDDPRCPFCEQTLSTSLLLGHYRAYFGAAYEELKTAIGRALADLDNEHAETVPAAFERAVRVWGERQSFWSRFCDVQTLEIDTAAIARSWFAARAAIRALLLAKKADPLDRIAVSEEARLAVLQYDGYRQTVRNLNNRLQNVNAAIRVVKEQATSGDPAALEADIVELKAIKARHSPEIALLCQDYLDEKAAKAETQNRHAEARDALDQYRSSVFPSYQTAINQYLGKFGAGFRLARFESAMTRGGSACTYSVGIGASEVPVSSTAASGSPSFRSTLSAGDRNTLALAFFFASLDQDTNLLDKAIVIDDPISSLDEHRSHTTVQEIAQLSRKAGQVIVLSHSKPFLCEIWDRVDKDGCLALEIRRQGESSDIFSWNINHDLVTEHDRRHQILRGYLESSGTDNRKVAEALRPVLEKFVRVAYPEFLHPGDMLGKFVNICEQRLKASDPILDSRLTRELNDLLSYANRFHHDTNRAYETEIINDGQLFCFVERTLAFTRH